jgi:methyl-accepting chemotaxis protein
VRHRGYGVRDEHYDIVGAALLDTLAAALGDTFNSRVKEAWTEVYKTLASTMMSAQTAQAA